MYFAMNTNSSGKEKHCFSFPAICTKDGLQERENNFPIKNESEDHKMSSIVKRRFSDNEGNIATIRIIKESNLFHVVIFNKYGQSLFYRFYSSTQAARKAIIRKGFSELKE